MENVAPGFRGHFIALLLQLCLRLSTGDQYTLMLSWLETLRNGKIYWVNNNRQSTIASVVYIAFNIIRRGYMKITDQFPKLAPQAH